MTGRPPKPPVLTAAQLRRIGELLYGNQWVSPLARELKQSRRNLQYMANGTYPFHAGLTADLAKVVRKRAGTLGKEADRIEALLTPHQSSERLPTPPGGEAKNR